MTEVELFFDNCPFCDGILTYGHFKGLSKGVGECDVDCNSCKRNYTEIWEIKKTVYGKENKEETTELISCPHCESRNLHTSSTYFTGVRTMGRDILCKECEKEMSEIWEYKHIIINEKDENLMANII